MKENEKKGGDQEKNICMGESDLATSIPKMLTSPFAHFHNTKHSDMDYFFEYTCFGDNICKYITLYQPLLDWEVS